MREDKRIYGSGLVKLWIRRRAKRTAGILEAFEYVRRRIAPPIFFG